MRMLKYFIASFLISVPILASSVQEQGFNDGKKAILSDAIMTKAYTEFKRDFEKAKSNSDRYVLKSGLGGSVRGSCLRLTYGDTNKAKIENKDYVYLKAFEKGCFSVY